MKPGPEKRFDPDVALDAAVRVFWARGFEAASISELTKAMRINRKSLYDTFGNKRSLFLKALARYSQDYIGTLRSTLLAEGSALANLKVQIQRWRLASGARVSAGCLFGTNIADFDTSDAEVSQILHLNLLRVEEALREALERARRDGELSPSLSAGDCAKWLVCLSQGAALIGRVSESNELLDGAYDAAWEVLSR